MSSINKIKCDGPDCNNERDNNSFGSPSYHKLQAGGSDFELSFGGRQVFDFCSFECLKNWLNEKLECMKLGY